MPATKPLLSRPEQLLYARLVRAFPGHVILVHVALSRLLVANFVVCRPDFTAVAAVELDEPTTKSIDAQRSAVRHKHRRKDLQLQAAGVKVIRIAAHDLPDERALKSLVAALPLSPPGAQVMRRASRTSSEGELVATREPAARVGDRRRVDRCRPLGILMRSIIPTAWG
jgi:hypothetical protein